MFDCDARTHAFWLSGLHLPNGEHNDQNSAYVTKHVAGRVRGIDIRVSRKLGQEVGTPLRSLLGMVHCPHPFLETNRQIYCISAWQQNPSLSLRDVVAALFRLLCQRLESKSGERVRHSIATAMDMHVAAVTVIALSHIVCHQLID